MFERSRRRIVAAIMSVLTLLFLGTLAIIYGTTYFEVSETNHEMLERYAALYTLNNQPGDNMLHPGMMEPIIDVPKGDPDSLRFEDTPAFQLSTFYSVAISNSGEILAIDNSNRNVYEDTKLEEYSVKIMESSRAKGTTENLIYLTADKDGYTLVAFMDNTIMQESMTTLFRYTLVFGGAAMVALFFVAVYLARRIVQPLEETYHAQKQFISDAGHELKTPVSVVSANVELLSREIGENQWLANIQYENERMGTLIGQLLELARTENVATQTERLDLSRLVVGEALPFESVAFEKGLVLNSHIADGLFVDGSASQLKQLVSILLDNAIQHSSGGREIDLHLKAERGFAKLSVINDGDEIPSEQRAQLFDRFYRADSARNGEGGHYGLGLAIAKAIVMAHKGKINVLCDNGKVEFVVRILLNQR